MSKAEGNKAFPWRLLGLPAVLILVFLWGVSDQPFFWDSLLQGSKWAHWYLDNDFASLLLPEALDAGHPPFFAVYLALVWKCFGKSLAISHWALLPILLGILWQLYRLIRYFLPTKHWAWALLLLLTDATLIGHSSLVSPDILLCFGFLLALNGWLHRRPWQLTAGALCFGLVSIRGLFALAAIGGIILVGEYLRGQRNWLHQALQLLLALLPAALLLLAYYSYHYAQTGWWLSTPNAAWSEHRSWIGLSGLVRNIAVLGWRLLDFGHIASWLLLLLSSYQLWRRRQGLEQNTRLLLTIPLITLLAYAPALILISNPIGHRYLLPLYLSITLLATHLLAHAFGRSKLLPYLVSAAVLLQLSGHFWIYPAHIAQGWDASLAYLPYGELRSEMITYIDEQGIPPEEVGTVFPNIGPMNFIDLSGRQEGFVGKDLERQRWIFYANVFNDFTDEELQELQSNWREAKRLERRGICVILYEKK
ncbi:MAG: hypothetical protein AAGG75_06250 [Bacteroidota bacterium]